MISHDATVGTAATSSGPVAERPFDSPDLLATLAAGPLASVLDFELIEPVWFESMDAKDVARVHCWPGTEPEGLISITRPGNDVLARQLEYVRNYADLRPDRIPEIVLQINDLRSFFGATDYLDSTATKWTLELLGAGVRLAIMVEMRLKHALNCPRPILFSPRVQPVIQTPGHGTLPSGHATEAFMVATLLTHLNDLHDLKDINRAKNPKDENFEKLVPEAIARRDQRFRLAARIAINRTVAGVHFPVDSAAGAVLGITLGEYVAARASGREYTPARTFDASKYAPEGGNGEDFNLEVLETLLKANKTSNTEAYVLSQKGLREVPKGKHIAEVWKLARAETEALLGPYSKPGA